MTIRLPEKEAWLAELSFLERVNNPVPMPVYTPHLIEIMKTTQEEALPWTLFVEGMVILLAADPDFRYAKEYKDQLKQDPAVLAALREKMQDLADANHPMAFPFALTLYTIEEDAVSASILAALFLPFDEKTAHRMSLVAETTDESFVLARLLPVYQQLQMDKKREALLTKLLALDAPGDELYRRQLHQLQQNRIEQQAEAALSREDFHETVRQVDDAGEAMRSGKMYALRGLANQGLGLFDASIRDLEQAIDKQYETPELLNDLSIAYYLTGQAEEAISVLEEGIQKHGTDERLLYNLFVYAIQTDRTDLAVETLETLRSIEISDPQIRSDVERITGNNE